MKKQISIVFECEDSYNELLFIQSVKDYVKEREKGFQVVGIHIKSLKENNEKSN